MVYFQEIVEILVVYWFRRRLEKGWREDLFCKVAKSRLKMGFRRPLVWSGNGSGLERSRVFVSHTRYARISSIAEFASSVC